jgi:hypothetical protein
MHVLNGFKECVMLMTNFYPWNTLLRQKFLI